MNPITYILVQTIGIIKFALLVWIVLSWLISFRVLNTSNRLVYRTNEVLNRLFEPMIRPIRRYMPDLGGIDISPIILWLSLELAQYTLRYYFY